MPITSNELRAKFLEFFKSKKHTVIPAASLIPENDPTVLFTTAGMHPLVPYLLGEEHPGGKRLTSVQKCIRTGDIDEVGDTTHLTFFEMLGNWSLGDYFKKEAIEWSFEFLTSKKWLNLPLERLAFSCFAGDQNAPRDTESADLWKSHGVPNNRIAFLGKEDNWWGPAGQTGPCGPDTEIFYWIDNHDPAPSDFQTTHTDKRWVEIWNDVFMQYNKTVDGKFEVLTKPNVDTGMGLERTVAVLNGTEIFTIDSFTPLIKTIEQLSGKSYANNQRAMRIIADHVRSALFIMADVRGVNPSNIGQGYVVRRLIRRAIRYGRQLGIAQNFITDVAQSAITYFKNEYPELVSNWELVKLELIKEENKFSTALEKGLKEFSKLEIVNGSVAFDLYQSYGFPLELTEELSRERGLVINTEQFAVEFKKHQDLSRTASTGVFKGGLADHSEEVIKMHTVTHLLQQALRDVLGNHIAQKGSNITKERLRFDFSHLNKMTSEEITKVEQIVNNKIKADLPVHFEILTIDEAKQRGAIGLFDDKYAQMGGKVKVYFIGDYSAEICGGPHVEHTTQIGNFKIIKEEAVSAGVRRIKAIIS